MYCFAQLWNVFFFFFKINSQLIHNYEMYCCAQLSQLSAAQNLPSLETLHCKQLPGTVWFPNNFSDITKTWACRYEVHIENQFVHHNIDKRTMRECSVCSLVHLFWIITCLQVLLSGKSCWRDLKLSKLSSFPANCTNTIQIDFVYFSLPSQQSYISCSESYQKMSLI